MLPTMQVHYKASHTYQFGLVSPKPLINNILDHWEKQNNVLK